MKKRLKIINNQKNPLSKEFNIDVKDMLYKQGVKIKEELIREFISFIREESWVMYYKSKIKEIQDTIKNIRFDIPCPKRGEQYSHSIAFSIPTGISDVTFSFSVPGLEFSKDGNLIKIFGTPSEVGIYKIEANYIYDNFYNKDKEIVEYSIEVLVNPRDLWKTIPTPKNIEYYKPDFDINYKLGQKRMLAASQRGRSHAHEAKPRDDDFYIAYDEKSNWHILTVADGAGSAIYSREGSRIACTTVVNYCLQELKNNDNSFEKAITDWSLQKANSEQKKIAHSEAYKLLGKAAFSAFKEIEKEAKSKGRSIRQYATTLLLSVCKKISSGWLIASFWVGDGGLGLYNKDTKQLHIMGNPDGGEFAGQTQFLTNSEIFVDAINRIRVDVVDDFTALILMSDGITDPKFETDNNLRNIEYWDKLWLDIDKEVDLYVDTDELKFKLLRWMDFWSVGNHDDRTIAILY